MSSLVGQMPVAMPTVGKTQAREWEKGEAENQKNNDYTGNRPAVIRIAVECSR